MQSTELSKTDKILKGVEIIRKHEPDARFAASYDILYFDSGRTKPVYDDETLELLEELGWFIDEDTECWATFV